MVVIMDDNGTKMEELVTGWVPIGKDLAEIVAEVVKELVRNGLKVNDLPDVVTAVYQSFRYIRDLEEGKEVQIEEKEVDWKASIKAASITCLVCGQEFKQVRKSHLKQHGMTPKEYKVKFGIPKGTTLSSKNLSKRRKEIAREIGLGRKVVQET